MKLKKLRVGMGNPSQNRDVKRIYDYRFTPRGWAQQLADFLNCDFTQKQVDMPAWLLPVGNPETASGRAILRQTQTELKKLVVPALDAFARGKTGADEFAKLVLAFNELVGNLYCFERKIVNGIETDQWERRMGKSVRIGSPFEYYLARLADLFDNGKLDYLARCRCCGVFFVTAGRGKAAVWAPGHRNTVANANLREQNYFTKRYQERVKEALKAARVHHRKGIHGTELIKKLRQEGHSIGKTLLTRHKLWEESDK